MKWMMRALASGALTLGALGAQAATIGFDDLTGDQDDPFYVHSEDGFSLSGGGGEQWVKNIADGRPAPSVIFHRPRGAPELWASMLIRADDFGEFTFASIDLYSSLTPIPYRFLGYLDFIPVFDVYGTMHNTFGQFVTELNPHGDVLIDALYIELYNPYLANAGNPVGLDNLVLSAVYRVPEPASLILALVALAAAAAVRSRSRRRFRSA